MLRHPVALGVALGLALLRLPARGAEPAPRPLAVVDLHVDLPYQLNYKGAQWARGSGQFSADELLRAGVVGVVLPLFVPARVSPTGPRRADLEGSYRRVVESLPGVEPYALPGCGVVPGKVRTFLAFEGAAPLAAEPAALDEWVQRGLRSVGLVHTRNNALATSSGEPGAHGGLTAQGRRLVRRAAALGVPIDVSHASDTATRDVVALARATQSVVIATHSNARAVTHVARNLADAELRAIAETGGVIGVNFHSRFLARGRRATLDDVVSHILYLVRLVGDEHVALGSDFEGDILPPVGLEDVRAFPALGHALERRGLTREAVARIFALNALRVLCGDESKRAP